MPDHPIDYLHLDMVGAESGILGPDSEWTRRVRSLKIQLYRDRGFAPDECLELLGGLGFDARLYPGHYGTYAFGARPGPTT